MLPDVQLYLGNLADWRVSESRIYVRFDLADGTRVDSEWLLIPLESAEDQRRLLSLQITGAWIEEAREVTHKILQPLLGRIGRYPSMGVKPTWEGLIMTTNPWPDGSDWAILFEHETPEGYVLFRQPSGLSDRAENVENLPEGYYERLCEGASQEFIDVSVHGFNGSDLSGLAVFRDAFQYGFHTTPQTNVVEGRTFILGLDTDRNPAVLIAQRDAGGALIVHQELFAEGVGLERFFNADVTPMMYECFPGSAYVIADPSGVKRDSISEESQHEAVRRLGYDCVRAPTNKIEPRLRAIDNLLTSTARGHPAIVISRAGCPMLIRALSSEYRYPRDTKGELTPAPQKKHPWSDLVDALSYLALGFGAARMGRPIGPRGIPMGGAAKAVPDRRAWT